MGAFLGNPQCVILDEPLANHDPSSLIRFKEMVKKHIENRATIFLNSSHDLDHITEVYQRIVLQVDCSLKTLQSILRPLLNWSHILRLSYTKLNLLQLYK